MVKLVSVFSLLVICSCGGGGASSPNGGGGDPGDPPPFDLGPTGDGVLLRTQHTSDATGNISLQVDSRSMTLSLKSVETDAPVLSLASDFVSDDVEVAILPLDPLYLPIPRCIAVEDQSLSLHSVFYRRTGGGRSRSNPRLCGVTELPQRHAEHLLQTTFQLDVAGVGWEDAARVLNERMVDWLGTRTTRTSETYILAFIPQMNAEEESIFKVQVFRGDAAMLSAWFSDEYTEALGRDEYTFSVYRVRDPNAPLDPLVLVPNIVGGLRPLSGSGRIVGRITTADDSGIAGVRVTALAFDPAAPALPPVMTNASGDYVIQDCPDGEYVIVSEKPGYGTAMSRLRSVWDVHAQGVVVSDGGTATFDDDMRASVRGNDVDTQIVYVRRGESHDSVLHFANLSLTEALPWEIEPLQALESELAGFQLSAVDGVLQAGAVQRIGITVDADARVGRHRRYLRAGENYGTEAASHLLYVVVLGEDPFDLSLDSLQLLSPSVQRGESTSIDYSWSTTPGAAPHCIFDVRLSPNATIDDSDRRLDLRELGPFGSPWSSAGESGSGGMSLDMPDDVEPGTYYLAVRLDATGLLEETNETNNVRVVPITITDSSGGSEVEIGPFSVTARTVRDSRESAIEVRWDRARGATEYRVRRLSSTSLRTGLSVPEVVRDWASAALGRIFIDTDVSPGQQCRYEVDARNGSSSVRSGDSESASGSSGFESKNLVRNGTFRSGGRHWELTGDFWAGTGADFPNFNKGRGYAAGGVNSDGEHIDGAAGGMAQQFLVPQDARSLRLKFYYNVSTSDSSPQSADIMRICMSVDGECEWMRDLSNRTTTGGEYERVSKNLDVSKYAGKQVTLTFACVTNGVPGTATVFRIDDVSVLAEIPVEQAASVLPRWPMTGTVTSVDPVGGVVIRRDTRRSSDGDVFPVAPGQVLEAGHTAANGWFVRIDHGGGWQSVYLNLDDASPFDANSPPLGTRSRIGSVRVGRRLEFFFYRDVGGRLNKFDRGIDEVAGVPSSLPVGTAQVREGRDVATWEVVPGVATGAKHNWLAPLPSGPWEVTQGAGENPSHLDGASSVGLHWALDLVPTTGNSYTGSDRIPVYSVHGGLVVVDGDDDHFNGFFVRVNERDASGSATGIETTYAHLENHSVATPLKGSVILAGTLIGYMGGTGKFTRPDGTSFRYGKHLHFSVTHDKDGKSSNAFLAEEVRLEGKSLEDYPGRPGDVPGTGSVLHSTR